MTSKNTSSIWSDFQREQVINTVLRISLQSGSLVGQLQLVLATLLSVPLYSGKAKGVIVLKNEAGEAPQIINVGVNTSRNSSDYPGFFRGNGHCSYFGDPNCKCVERFFDGCDDIEVISEDEDDANANSNKITHILVPIVGCDKQSYGVIHIIIDLDYELVDRDKGFLKSYANAIVGLIDKNIAETKLIASEQRLSMAVDASNISLWRWNVDEDYMEHDDKWHEILGYDRETFRQQVPHWKMLVHPDDWQTVLDNFDLHRKGVAQYIKTEMRIRESSGAWRWFLCKGRFTEFDENHEPLCATGIHLDIDDKKKSEDDLIRADRYKTEFLSNLSHELRTPLNSIIGFSAALKKGIDGPVNPEQKDSLSHILSSSQRLLTIIEDILDLSLFETDSIELNIDKTSLDNCIQAVVDSLKDVADENNDDIQCHFPVVPISVRADAVLLGKAIKQLVLNAIKYTRNGQISVEYSLIDNVEEIFQKIELKSSDNYVLIKVKDSGAGISKEHFEQIFHSFHQLDCGSAKKYAGLGIGLSLVKSIVEKHGGKVWVQSEPGKGSTFFTIIPSNTN